MILNFILIIVGFALLVKGADYLVDGASSIAKKFHIKEIVIGLTIVSIGTSMPEFVVSLTSSLNNHSDMAIGNIVGSNISNLFFILGACAALRPLKFKEQTVRLEIPLVIFLTALLYLFGNNGPENIITRQEGFILLIFCLLFILYNIFMAKKGNDIENSNPNETLEGEKIYISIFNILIGIIALKFGGDFVVDNSSALALKMGISEKIVSLTIVAFSTSLPELITSINATLKGEVDIAIGNIIGSNILNIVLIIGATALISPIAYSISYNKDIIIFMLGMLALGIIPFVGEKNKISRISGITYVFSYFSYMMSLIYVNLI